MQLPSITCPCCQLTSRQPDDVNNAYCGRCHWWTSDEKMAPYHFALPCEYRGAGVLVPRLGDWYRETHWIVRPGPWLHTQPGTLLELGGGWQPAPRPPWWRRLLRRTRRLARHRRPLYLS